MDGPIGQADYDYLARKLGFKDMQEVHAKRKEEEAAAERARIEAEAKAVLEEQLLKERAEDARIRDSLKTRMTIAINGEIVKGLESPKDIACPGCRKPLSWARETLLMSMLRASYRGENWTPEWRRSGGEWLYGDVVPAGPDSLVMRTPTLLFAGEAKCTSCGRSMELAIEIDCLHDGERIGGLRGSKNNTGTNDAQVLFGPL